ncbi:Glyco_tran_10_N domain-containing protein [Meloidogyne graminicola]|uniref:Fucosyltransferase n=1 Tax=Meloidogyne graminicola TaxID=189291 RepID=A0A8S9ZQ49_9BILA|nr:Glyco_tran_10_N domain-containing protein [Meloidogyne graminicola]
MTEKVKNQRGLKVILVIAILALFALLYLFYTLYYNQFIVIYSEVLSKEPIWITKESVLVRWPTPLIIIWTGFYGNNFLSYWSIKNITEQCPYKCRYSDDKSLEKNASVILFHIRDRIDPLPKYRTPEQLYTFFVLESPPHTWGMGRDVSPDFFNITMTYRSDSDVLLPYDMFESYSEEDLKNGFISSEDVWTEEEIDRKIGNKTSLTLQFVSNCNTHSRREKYIEELKKYTEITQMGSCSGKKECDTECVDKLIDSHYFYLAFENSVCIDYLSEKFWRIKKLIVPVVLSRKIFKGVNVPSDSFIAADDFKSPKELIEHLKSVVADKNKYKSYLRWTQKYKRTLYSKEFWYPSCTLCTSLQPFCELCKLAHKNKKELKIKNIYELWNDGGRCQAGFAESVLLG